MTTPLLTSERKYHQLTSPLTLALALLPALFQSLGAQNGTAWTRRSPDLNGLLIGSVRMMEATDVELAGTASISGDLQIPGMPVWRVQGRAILGSVADSVGPATPSGHEVRLAGSASVGRLLRRVAPAAWPTVVALPVPAGTRTVVLREAAQSPGDFRTLRDLTLEAKAGAVAVPPGNYGSFEAIGGVSLVLGEAGRATAVQYSFRELSLKGVASLQLRGPVEVVVGGEIKFSGESGSSEHPEWLRLHVVKGGLELEAGARFYGYVQAPSGTATIGGKSLLKGGVVAERFVLRAGGEARLIELPNVAPQVRWQVPPEGTVWVAPATVSLVAEASDPDGRVTRVEFWEGAVRVGEATASPYRMTLNAVVAGSHTYVARAIDDRGVSAESAPLVVVVKPANVMPLVALVAPPAGSVVTAPGAFTLVASASDPDGGIAAVEFFDGPVLLGRKAAAPYEWAVAGLEAGLHRLQVVATDLAGLRALSAPVDVIVNAPPVVTLEAPSSGAVYTAPASILLIARAADVDGIVARVDFYRGLERIGSFAAPPFSMTIAEPVEAAPVFTARAWDNRGAVALSAPVSVTVRPANQAPTVALVKPVDGATYLAPATVLLEARASDADGRVARVEFYGGTTKLGESIVSPFQLSWLKVAPGSHVVSAKAYDDRGAMASSLPARIRVDIGVPYFTGFETNDGYAAGTLAGQLGWTVAGMASVAAGEGQTGSSALVIGGGTAGSATRAFPASPGEAVMFGEMFVKPTADADPARAVFADCDGVVFALVGGPFQAEIRVRRVDAGGTASWLGTGRAIPLSSDGRPPGWTRLTWRVDGSTRRFDVWLDGRLAISDEPLPAGASGSISSLTWMGRTLGPVAVDDIYLGYDNPLFADADRDGMDDGWEIAHGTDPARNDRALDPDGDGLSNIDEFRFGTHPRKADTDGDGVDDGAELRWGLDPNVFDATLLPAKLGGLRLHLKADVGLVLDGGGRVQTWEDQSGAARHASQLTESSRPLWLAPGRNGQPAVWLDGYDDYLRLGSPLAGAVEGEVLVVLRAEAPLTNVTNTLWTLGGVPTYYPHVDGAPFEGFGSNIGRASPLPEADLSQWRLYSVAAANGRWRNRLDGRLLTVSETNTFTAGDDAVLGYAGSPNFGRSFHGAIAEVLVFDRVLSWREREELHRYLARRHQLAQGAPSPAIVTAKPVSSSQVSLTWTGSESTAGMVSVVERRSAAGVWETIAVLEDAWSHLDELPAGMTTTAYRVRLAALGGSPGFGPAAEVNVGGMDPGGIPLGRTRLWLKADHAVGYRRVSLWPDASGRGRHAVPVAGLPAERQPARAAAGWQGRPVVRFDGYDDALSVADFLSGSAGTEIYAVLRNTGAVGGVRRTLWTFGAGETSFPGEDGAIHESFAARSPWQGPAPAQDLSSWLVYQVAAEGGRWGSRLDGHLYREVRSNVVTFNSTPGLGFGGSPAFGRAFEGEIAEILAFDRVLTEEERVAVGRYLNLRFPRVEVAPPAPVGLTVKAVSPTQASLTWAPAFEAIAAWHEIERQETGGPFRRIASLIDVASFFDAAISPGASVGYRVRMRNHAGASPWSSVVTVALPQAGTAIPLSALRFWSSADHGLVPGRTPTWPDRSELGRHAWQPVAACQPSLVLTAGGSPVVRLEAPEHALLLPDVMAGALEGEIVAVLRAAEARPAMMRTLWTWGNSPSHYPTTSGLIREGFGGSDFNEGPLPSVALDQMHLYDVSTERSGVWTSRINAGFYHARRGNTVSFRPDPSLGYVGSTRFGSAFVGDLAEIMVFGRALTDAERTSVSAYLVGRHPMPGMAKPPVPTGLKATPLSGTQLNLTWSVPSAAVGLTYVVERRTGTGSFVVAGRTSEQLAWLDGGRVPGEAVSYRVKATGLGGESDFSEVLSLTVPVGPTGVELPAVGLRLWLRADLEPIGGLGVWSDQSGWRNHARQSAVNSQPSRVIDADGIAGVRFDGQDDCLALPNLLAMATEAEAFVVVRATADPAVSPRGLWRFSLSSGSTFPDASGILCEDFGSTWSRSLGDPAASLASYGVYSVSAGPGAWSAWLNGRELRASGVNTVSFRSDPWLGSSGSASFAGDIAEVLIFDRRLSDVEREAVGANLTQRYRLPATPVPEAPRLLQAEASFPSRVRLTWFAGSLDAGVAFSIERQVAGQAFALVGDVTTAGQFIDPKPPTGTALAYRVRARTYAGFSAYSNVAAITLPADRDGDGLPDEWELRVGTQPDIADAAGDPDGDGLPNSEEFRRGGNALAGVQADPSPVRLRVHEPRPSFQP